MTRFRKARTLGLLILLLGLLYEVRALPVPAKADHGGNPSISDIVLTAPQTYMICPSGTDSDVVALSNVGTRWLKGYVQLDFVIPDNGGRQLVQRWDVFQGGDYRLEIVYPAWEAWPDGFFEMHVDLVFEVYPTEADAQAGINLLGTIGPGHPWDIFCLAVRPTATPSPAITPSPTPSWTPTSTPTLVAAPPTPPSSPSPTGTPTAVPPVAPPVPPPTDPTPLPTEPLNGELLGRMGAEGPQLPVPWILALALWIAGGLVLGWRSRRRDRV
ncbi:hypothetical protein [Thermoflexus sp.]|uniref:hypothetical protein n=1 Tax=Thermoflexus sp. TaxID=1969742 RepID=UPI0035E454E3